MEIAHIASLIKLPLPTVEAKLSQMVLDKKFAGGWAGWWVVGWLAGWQGWGLADHVRCLHASSHLPCSAGTLDQGVGTLEVFEEEAPDAVYPGTLDTFESLGRVVESLAGRTAKITAAA